MKTILGLILAMPFLTSCAIGSGFSCASATSAWALKSNEADCLSSSGERHLIQEIKAQLHRENFNE